MMNMYLHLGKGKVIDSGSIIGIFDLDNTSQSHITRKFLNMSEKAGLVINASEDIPKSFVVTEYKGKINVYLSQMAVATLNSRLANI